MRCDIAPLPHARGLTMIIVEIMPIFKPYFARFSSSYDCFCILTKGVTEGKMLCEENLY